jgi:hypothetical protein
MLRALLRVEIIMCTFSEGGNRDEVKRCERGSVRLVPLDFCQVLFCQKRHN